MYRDRQFHRGKECSGTDNYLEFHFKSVSKHISEKLTRPFAVLVSPNNWVLGIFRLGQTFGSGLGDCWDGVL